MVSRGLPDRGGYAKWVVTEKKRTGAYISAEDVATGPRVVGLVTGAGDELRRRGFAVVDDVAGRDGGRARRAGHAVRPGPGTS